MRGPALRWVSRLLEQLLPEDEAKALVGDLLEEHALWVRTEGRRRAAFWYWGQVVRSVVALLNRALRRGEWVRASVAGFVAYSFAAAAEISARGSVAPVATRSAVDAIPVLIIYLPTLVLAAYVAERVSAGAAVAIGLLVALAAVVQLVADPPGVPLWYRCAVLIAGPAAVLVGRRIFTRWSGARMSRRRSSLA